MTSTQTKYNISEASRITGKSRNTIAAHLKAGKLSSKQDETGHKLIDGAELSRFYGDACDFERARPDAKTSQRPQANRAPKDEQAAQVELRSTQQLLESERNERERERQQLQARIDSLEEALERAQEGHNRVTMLLEDRTAGAGELERSLRRLEQRLDRQQENSQHELKKLKETAKSQIAQYRRALQDERNKSFLQKLFGRQTAGRGV